MSGRLSPLLVLLLPYALAAQEGSIAYTHSVKVEIPEEIRARLEARPGGRGGPPGGPGMFPTERTSDVVLLFDATQSLMTPVPRAEPEARPGPPGGGDRARAAGFMARMRMASANRADRETLVEAHAHFADGTIVEAREFLGRTFIIEDERPAWAWRLTGEQAEFLGYMVQKATAVQDSTTIEAWFTPEIPVPGGPGRFGGLPGMILVVSLDGGREQYSATQVLMTEVEDGLIARPSEGEEVTREAYEKIVAEKLEELRRTRRRIPR